MSHTAYNWARDLKTLNSSTLKAVLKELASFENGNGHAWCDIATLVRFTDQNRKTVIAGLAELVKRGIIEDTGKRSGTTKQIPVYRLVGYETDFERTRREEQEEAVKGTGNGTLPDNAASQASVTSQAVEKTAENADISPADGSEGKESQKRNGSENGTVPKTDGKSPVFTRKESQKRDTTDSYRVLTQDAGASARGRTRSAASQEPESPAVKLEAARLFWQREIISEFLGAISAAIPELAYSARQGIHQLPQRLADHVVARANPIAEQFADRQISTGVDPRQLSEAMRAATRPEAEIVVSCHRSALAPAHAA